MNGAADEIGAAPHALPERIAGHDRENIAVRTRFGIGEEAASSRGDAEQRKEVVRHEKHEAPAHGVIATNPNERETQGGDIAEDRIGGAEGAELGVRELAIIAVGLLASREDVHHFVWPFRHHRAEQEAVDQRKDRGVDADGDAQRRNGHEGETGRFGQRAEGKAEVVHGKVAGSV